MLKTKEIEANDNIPIIGLPRSHDALREIFSDLEPVKTLDIPVGHGSFTQYLTELGWDDVDCADIDQGNLKITVNSFKEVNLNKFLPYDNESYEIIVCINGLHRLYNPACAIQEFARMLKPGGRVFLNFNNYMSIKARLRFFLFGSIDAAINSGHTIQTIENPEANVRQPLMFPQVGRLLDESNLEVKNIFPASKNKWYSIFYPISIIIKFITLFISKERSKGQYLEFTNNNSVLIGGDYILIEAVKREIKDEKSTKEKK